MIGRSKASVESCIFREANNQKLRSIHFLESLSNQHAVKKILAYSVITTSDLKWNKQILEISSKANRMLGCVKRTALAIHDVSVRKDLYMTMVRNHLAYCCQVWAPRSVNNISTIERVQRRATKFILSLPYNTNILYKEKLVTIGIIPICYWHEYVTNTQRNMLLIPLSDLAGVGGWHCPPHHQRLIAN